MDKKTDDLSGTAERETYTRELPVIDVGPIIKGDKQAAKKIAKEWREIYENLGFLCIVNHGIPQDLIERTEQQCAAFHKLPPEEKLKIKINENQRGLIPSKGTVVAHSTYNKNTKLDINETLVFATEYEDDDPGVLEGKQFYGKNQWPEGLPGFKETVNEYMTTMTVLGKSLLPIWAAALELPEDFFDPYFQHNYTYFRMAYYPPMPDFDANRFGLGPHADTGFQTLLPPSKEEGLQILDTDGNWFWPQVADGAIILNAGQFLERWSNEVIRATPHRVLPPRENDRYSLACFVNTNFESLCEPLPTCVSEDNPPKYGPETYWDFYTWYMHRTYPHYGTLKTDGDQLVEEGSQDAG